MTVFLVGAGPGDPGLLTLRGRDLIAAADVVLHDGLVNPRILAFAPPRATLVDVSKTEKGHAFPQQEINALLVRFGREAQCVVRLKGGDPFVFGRGGEEALALAEAGIPFEVVPGVSAAVAAPAYAGIPVTHRALSSSVTFVTGHEAPKAGGAARVDWAKLATAGDTLVVLMGVGRLGEIVAALTANGRDPQTPAAIVERGSTPAQRVITSPLGELPARAAEAAVQSPAVIVVGEVAGLASELAWYLPLPREEPAPVEPATVTRDTRA